MQRLAEHAYQLAVALGGVAAGSGGDLRRQQRRNDAVLVGRPDAAVAPQEARTGTLFAAKAERAFAQASIHPVTSSPAGPPLGRLYLNSPLSGGLCDGVTTIPSASPLLRPRL